MAKAKEEKKDKSVQIKQSELEQLKKDAEEYKDKYIRLAAEFENARKRNERERMEFAKFANEEIISEFLSILDNLERSVEAAQAKHQDYEAFLKGMEMVMGQIHELFKNNGVQPIETVGKIFDPHCHEILIQEPSDKHKENEIIEEFQKGYKIHDRIIRTAKVKVATAAIKDKQ